jgi:protein-tyrosine phosphatase
MSKYEQELSPDMGVLSKEYRDKKNKCMVKEDPLNLIVDNLYLGNNKSTYDYDLLKKNKIEYIIRVLPEFDYNRMYSGIKYIHIPIKDNETCGKKMTNILNKISDFIHQKVMNRQRVLVACMAGHHRSGVFVSAYLIKYRGYNVNTAKKYINKIRPCAMRRDNVCMYYALNEFQKDHKKTLLL